MEGNAWRFTERAVAKSLVNQVVKERMAGMAAANGTFVHTQMAGQNRRELALSSLNRTGWLVMEDFAGGQVTEDSSRPLVE